MPCSSRLGHESYGVEGTKAIFLKTEEFTGRTEIVAIINERGVRGEPGI